MKDEYIKDTINEAESLLNEFLAQKDSIVYVMDENYNLIATLKGKCKLASLTFD